MGDWLKGQPGAAESHTPGRQDELEAPAPAVAERVEAQTPEVEREEPKKKRGFWSRIFGRRDKDEDEKKDQPKRRP
jgi:hypothetical protein